MRYPKFAGAGVMILWMAGVLVATGHAAIDPDTVVGAWLFESVDNGTIRDDSDNGHDGQVQGNPELVKGQFGSALQFNGAGDFVSCGNDESLNLDTFTVAFWANMPATQGWNHMVSRGSHVGWGAAGSVNWGVMIVNNEKEFLFEIFENTEWTGIKSDITLKQWHHVVATYDGDKMELYIDGISRGSEMGVQVELDASREFRIGGISTAGPVPGNFFNGTIDEVIYFNTVLSAEDIQVLMNDGYEHTVGVAAVSPAAKLSTIWGTLKNVE